MTAEERIVDLVKPNIMDCIPSFIKRHVVRKNCQWIAREYPALYAVFSEENEPDEPEKAEMAEIANGIFEAQIRERQMR